jgi:GTPase
MLPIVAIIGRPNVGKSTLFNRIVGRRQAVVHNQPGVTRDRLYGTSEWDGRPFRVVDTGGMLMGEDVLSTQVTEQSAQAIAEADVVIAVFDGREGLTTLDREIGIVLRQADCAVIYAVNKCDTEESLEDFYQLGVDSLTGISAEHGRNVDALLSALVRVLPEEMTQAHDASIPRVALLGRPNVGKSTLINTLAQEERVVAHDMPGTTRDVIDVEIARGDERAIFLDTAGIRRKARSHGAVEKFSIIKSLRAIESANVVLLLIDATEGMTHQDRGLAAEAFSQGRPVVIAINKWDLVRGGAGGDEISQSQNAYIEGVRTVLGAMRRLPVVVISATQRRGIGRLWSLLHRGLKATQRRLTTSELNRLMTRIQQSHHIPVFRGHNVKLYYGTQTRTAPPGFVFFTNFPQAIPEGYRRFLHKHLEQALGVEGMPIYISFRKKTPSS